MRSRPFGLFLSLAMAGSLWAQQELPTVERVQLLDRGLVLSYAVQLPASASANAWYPVVLLFGEAGAAPETADARLAELAAAVARQGWVAVWPNPRPLPAGNALGRLPTQLRARFRIAQGGLHIVGIGTGCAAAVDFVGAQGWECQTLSLFGGPADFDVAAVPKLRGRPLVWCHGPAVGAGGGNRGPGAHLRRRASVPAGELAAALPVHLAALHAERELPGLQGELSRRLDDFHDAAANGDEDRYFAMLPDDAVFLGTDATECWSGAEFRAFAMPYFKAASAWTYVPFARHVTIAPDGQLAWFHEALDNEAYGECRGSGVLQRRDGQWVLRQYNLTIPVPNEIAGSVVARIRAFAAGRAPAVTTVVVVRHAEKGEGEDPDLTDAGRARAEALAKALRSLPVTACYASQLHRTAATLAPLCRERGLSPVRLTNDETRRLPARIKAEHQGQTVLVAGHSNTVPMLLQALGVAEDVKIGEDEFDHLFVVTIGIDGARLLRLHY